jgi:hypothetical protein
VDKKQFDNKIFTAEESPIPVIPPDDAWAAMRQQLDREQTATGIIIPSLRNERPYWKNSLYILVAGIAGLFLVLMLHTPRTSPATGNADLKSVSQSREIMVREIPAAINKEENSVVTPSIKKKKNKTKPAPETTTSEFSRLDETIVNGPELLAAAPNTNELIMEMPTALMDSLQKRKKVDEKPEPKIRINAGLQWQIPVPVNGTRYYFAGPDGDSEPYRLLLPSAWISIQQCRHRVLLGVNPFHQVQLPDKRSFSWQDSLMAFTTNNIVKTFGFGASLQYAYSIKNNWWLGVTAQGSWWKKALLAQRAQDSNVVDVRFSTIGKGDRGWEKISSFQIKTGVELSYVHKRWSAGVETLLPFTSTFSKPNNKQSTPLQVSILVRYQLLPLKH